MWSLLTPSSFDFTNLQRCTVLIQAHITRWFKRSHQFVYDHIAYCTSPSREIWNDHAAAGKKFTFLLGNETLLITYYYVLYIALHRHGYLLHGSS